MSTAEKPLKHMNMVLTTHFLGTRPPKRQARPGRLMRPTNVAAVSCQELSPVFNQAGSEQLLALSAHTDEACNAVVIMVWSNKRPLLVGSSGRPLGRRTTRRGE